MFRFSESGTYYVPNDGPHQAYVDYVRTLPLNPLPEVYGLHSNADITKDQQETQTVTYSLEHWHHRELHFLLQLFDNILLTLPKQTSGGEGRTPSVVIDELAADILGKLPADFDTEAVSNRRSRIRSHALPFDSVDRQEVSRAVQRIDEHRPAPRDHSLQPSDVRSAKDARRSAKGHQRSRAHVVRARRSLQRHARRQSTERLGGEILSIAQTARKLPERSDGSVNDPLILQHSPFPPSRLKFLQTWIKNGPPNVFWISGFFFTQSFLTGTSFSPRPPLPERNSRLGVLQNYARKYTIPIDKLAFEFDILDEDNDLPNKPENGAYIKGLFLEGARWNKKRKVLDESLPKVLFDTLPIIWLKPGATENFAQVNTYSCPVYKVSRRVVLVERHPCSLVDERQTWCT